MISTVDYYCLSSRLLQLQSPCPDAAALQLQQLRSILMSHLSHTKAVSKSRLSICSKTAVTAVPVINENVKQQYKVHLTRKRGKRNSDQFNKYKRGHERFLAYYNILCNSANDSAHLREYARFSSNTTRLDDKKWPVHTPCSTGINTQKWTTQIRRTFPHMCVCWCVCVCMCVCVCVDRTHQCRRD